MIASLRRSIAVIIAAVSLLAVTTVKGAQGFAVGSLDLGLTGQSGWFEWYNASDSPETAYLATIYETLTTVSGTVQLGRTVQPGRYYAAWKVIDYGGGGTLDFTIGGSPVSTSTLNSGDFNGQWTVPVAIDIPVASTTVQITLRRSALVPIGTRQIFLFRGIYLTTSQGEVVFSDDSIVVPQLATQVDSSPVRKGNLLENGGFEVGTGHGWGLGESSARPFSMASLWDNTVAYEGSASLKVPDFTQLVSRPYRVRGNRQFTLSAWVKTALEGTVTLTIQNGNVNLPNNYPPVAFLTQTFPINTTWQRVSLSGVLWDYPASDYYVRIKVNDPLGGFTWLDGLQLEEGGLTGYASGQPLEGGLVCSQPGNLFYEDESTTMQLWVRNSGSSSAAATVPYAIYDYLNRQVAAGSTNVVVPAHGRWSGSLNVATGLRGIFRVVLWIQGVEHTREEVVYGIVPRPQQTGLDTSSLIGIHANFTDFQCAALQKLGIKWNRASSPSRAFRWTTVQPTDPTFQWAPDDMTKATSHDISVLGTIGSDWPAWADAGGLPDLAKWEAFVGGVVNHYKTQVKDWEIGNEPQYSFTPAFYAQLLQHAVSAIRAADPQARIVGLGGVSDVTWCTNVLSQLVSQLGNNWLTNLSGVSTHLYPKFNYQAYGDFRNHVRDAYNIPVYNSEVGVWDRGFYMAENSDFIQTDYTWAQKAADRYDFGHKGAPELLAYAFLNNVGNGLSKFFYYDGRIFAGPGYAGSHSTIVEYDDSVRAKGVAFSVLARLFDHSAGQGDISPNASSSMFLFDRGGTPLVGIWSLDLSNRSLTLSLSGSSYRVYDLMGNLITISNGTIPYGGTPVYIEGQGISVATLRSAVQAGTVAPRADTTAPNLSLVIFPTGPSRDNPVKLRWLAIDETVSPSDGFPKAIEYSYFLQGYDAGFSPWSPGTYVDYFNVPPGTYQFQVKARDAAGNMSSISQVTVVVSTQPVSTPPILNWISDQTINELALLTIPISAIDQDLPAQTLTFGLVSGPSGVALNPTTGVLTWTPTTAQGPATHVITVRVVDNGSPSLSATQSFNVFVSNGNTPPTLASINNQTINELALLTVTLSASDPDPGQSLTYELFSAPAGVHVDPGTGILTWTPEESQGPGNYPITVHAFDNGSPSMTATQSFNIVVNEVNTAPALAPISNQTIDEFVSLILSTSATDSDLPAQSLTFELLTGPTGSTLNPTTGLFIFNPTETQGPSTRLVKIRVVDGGSPSLSATQTFNVVINEVNAAPVLAPINNQTIDELALLSVTTSAADSDLPAQTLTYALDSAPAGVNINPATGLITWTPTASQGPGTHVIKVRVSDNGSPSMSATQSFNVVVNDTGSQANTAPTLAAINNQTINELALLTVNNSATDADVPAQTLTYALVTAPAGATLNPTTGVFTWTPSESQGPGTHAITLRVSDNGSPILSSTQSFNVVVNEVNVAPTLAAISNQTINELALLTVNPSATDSDLPAQTLTYALVTAPAGATLNPTTGVITWTPTAAQGPATHGITLRAFDDGSPSLSATQSFNVVVTESTPVNTAAPVLASINNQTINELALLTVNNSATDADVPAQTLTYALVTAPAGATLNPTTGVFTWTPSESQGPGTHAITLRVSDNGSPILSSTQSFNVVVNEVNVAPTLAAISDKTTNELALFTVTTSATDSDLPAQTLTYELLGAPPGVILNPTTGVITWTPTEAQGPGIHTITLRASDNGSPSLSSSQSFNVVVNEVNSAPALAPINNQTINELALLTVNPSATDSDLPAQTLTYALVTAPAGATLNPTTGVITWTPTAAQGPATHGITLRAFDDGSPSLSATQSFNVVVTESTPVNTAAPVLASINNQTINELALLSVTNSATDADVPAQTLTYALVTAPAGATLNPTTGVITWTPSESQGPGTHAFAVRVSDNGSPILSSTQSFNVVVNEVNVAPVLAAIGNRIVTLGDTMAFTATATDSDLPAQPLTYSLDAGAPTGAALHPTTGAFTWTPTAGQSPSTNTVTIRVTDGSVQDSETLTLTVLGSVVLVKMTNSWKYDQSGGNLGTAWKETAFNDSAWPSGAALLYNENTALPEPKNTLLSLTAAGNRRITNYYFRAHFNLPADPTGVTLVASNLIDDGAVFYINGVEAGRTNMPAGIIRSTTLASVTVGDATDYIVFNLAASNLVAGDNVIAVEVHQSAANSTDIVFGMSLTARFPSQTPVVITSQPASLTVTAGSPAQFTVGVSGTNPRFQWFKGAVPIGNATNATYLISSAQPDDAGTYTVGISNALTSVMSSNATLTVNPAPNRPPTLTVPGPQTISELTLFTVTNIATDVDTPAQTLTFALNSAPTGVNLNPTTGVLTWTPAEPQGPNTNVITISVFDNGTPSLGATQSFTVIVNEVNSAPSLAVPANQTVDELATLIVTNTTTDADLPANTLSFALLSAPAGATLNPTTGVLIWTPTEPQGPNTNVIVVRAFDNGTPSLSTTQSFTVIVNEVNSAPTLTVPPTQTVNELATLSVTNTAADPDLPANTLTFEAISAPAGVNLDPTTGVLTWAPDETQGPNTNVITIRIFDNGTPSLSTTQSFTVIVNEVNVAPTLSPISNQTIDELALLTVTNFAGDSDLPAQTLTFGLLIAPEGVNLDAVTGILTWRPAETNGPGSYPIKVRVSDNGSPSMSATQSFNIVVNDLTPLQPLRFIASSALATNGVFRVQVTGGTNQGFIVIESSTNLLQWMPVYTNSATGGLFEFLKSTPPSFYRAKEQP